MSTHLDRALRDALENLADAPPPADLAQTALRGARRRRVAMRIGGLVVAGVAVVAAIPVVLASVASTPTHSTLPGTVPAGGRVVVAYTGIDPDGGVTDPGGANDTSLLLNFATGGYDSVPYNNVVPSPDNRLAVVFTGDNSLAHPSRIGILDRATNNVRWLPDSRLRGYEHDPVWSPDSRTIAIVDEPRKIPLVLVGDSGFRLVDAHTLAETFVKVDAIGAKTALGGNVTWTADGSELMVVLSDSVGESTVVTGIQHYELDGTARQTVTVNRLPAARTSLSPDGAWLLLLSSGTPKAPLVNTTTGAVQTVSQPGLLIGWYDPSHFIGSDVPSRTGPAGDWQIIDLSGSVIRSVTPPPGAPTVLSGLVIGSSDGLSSTGGQFVF